MYCILVTGIPASGKSTLAAAIAGALHLPWISKDRIKELLFDRLGFRSREEKVRLGLAAMDAMYYCAEQLMAAGKPFILENNFENSSREPLLRLLERHDYQAITLTLTGDYRRIYERFLLRNVSPERHRGHVVNTCYVIRSCRDSPWNRPSPMSSLWTAFAPGAWTALSPMGRESW